MKRAIFKKILYLLMAVVVLIQFFRPALNDAEAYGKNDITHAVPVPSNVLRILETSCFDCHSNHTVYPWYFRIQPIAWWMNYHVSDAKKGLNFSEFNAYKLKRQKHKMEEIGEMVQEKKMPLPSYLLIHDGAKLTNDQSAAVLDWAHATFNSIHLSDTLNTGH